MVRGWNWMIFKMPSNLHHSVWFYDDSMKNKSWKYNQSEYQDSEH